MATQLWTGSDDHTIRVWDVGTGDCLQVLSGHSGSVLSLTLTTTSAIAGTDAGGGSDDSQRGPRTIVMSSSEDGSIRVWAATGDRGCLRVIDVGHRVCTLACMGNEVWTCGQTPLLGVWNASKMQRVNELEGHNTCVPRPRFPRTTSQLWHHPLTKPTLPPQFCHLHAACAAL